MMCHINVPKNKYHTKSFKVYLYTVQYYINTLRLRQNGDQFADDILKYIYFNKNVWISINISLKFVPEAQINNITALVHKPA